MSERWLPISTAPGYEVSDLGRVRSWRRRTSASGPRILKPRANPWGYLTITMTIDDQRRVFTPQGLVMAAFVGPKPEGHDVRHLDGVKTNNALKNLAYGTRSRNILDCVDHGTHRWSRRSHCENGHEYTPENTRMSTSRGGRPYRRCRTCLAIYAADARLRRAG